MDRKEFIKACGFVCIGASAAGMLLQGCSASKMMNADIIGSDLIVPLSDFEIVKDNEKNFKKYIVVQNEQLQHPICVYRLDDKNYSAMLMQCTHQGVELQVFGDKLQCPAHGSEFDNKGAVQNGPADTNLRTFPVAIENNQLKISLQ